MMVKSLLSVSGGIFTYALLKTMKLHLPLSLLSSLLACMAAVSSPHAVAETYTWLGGTVDVHLNTNWTPDYGSSNWSATWAGTATNSMRLMRVA